MLMSLSEIGDLLILMCDAFWGRDRGSYVVKNRCLFFISLSVTCAIFPLIFAENMRMPSFMMTVTRCRHLLSWQSEWP